MKIAKPKRRKYFSVRILRLQGLCGRGKKYRGSQLSLFSRKDQPAHKQCTDFTL